MNKSSKKIIKKSNFNDLISKKNNKKSNIIKQDLLKTSEISKNKNNALLYNDYASGKRATKYNLFDNEEEIINTNLTHKGALMEKIDDFKDLISNDESEAEENNTKMTKLNFYNFSKINKSENNLLTDNNEEKVKTKKEIYNEIIKKSKKNKLEKKRNYEINELLAQQLDMKFDEFLKNDLKFNMVNQNTKLTSNNDYYKLLENEPLVQPVKYFNKEKNLKKLEKDNDDNISIDSNNIEEIDNIKGVEKDRRDIKYSNKRQDINDIYDNLDNLKTEDNNSYSEETDDEEEIDELDYLSLNSEAEESSASEHEEEEESN